MQPAETKTQATSAGGAVTRPPDMSPLTSPDELVALEVKLNVEFPKRGDTVVLLLISYLN